MLSAYLPVSSDTGDEYALAPFSLWCEATILIQAWMNNYIHYKVWDEIIYPFPNFNGATVEVCEWWYVISSHTLPDMWLLIHAGIKVKPR